MGNSHFANNDNMEIQFVSKLSEKKIKMKLFWLRNAMGELTRFPCEVFIELFAMQHKTWRQFEFD